MRIKPKKKLGQNFLLDRNVQDKIISACAFKGTDTVVEIGAGGGEFTALIAASAKKVFAVELDAQLCAAAAKTLQGFSNVEIIHSDILKFNFGKKFARTKVRVFGNIPYYISSAIIERLLESRDNISDAFITVQKEFAVRMAAGSGSKDYGSLSCFLQYYARPQVLFDIKKNSFFPAPKVDSSFVRLVMLSEPAVRVRDERFFFRVIRAAFNKRRKTLRNSLEGIVSATALKAYFDKYAIDRNIRPERLGLADFANLSNLACSRL